MDQSHDQSHDQSPEIHHSPIEDNNDVEMEPAEEINTNQRRRTEIVRSSYVLQNRANSSQAYAAKAQTSYVRGGFNFPIMKSGQKIQSQMSPQPNIDQSFVLAELDRISKQQVKILETLTSF